jgi:hypothetical protein
LPLGIGSKRVNLGRNGSRPRQKFVRLLPCYTPLLPENLSAPPGSRVKDGDEGERKEGGMDIFSVGPTRPQPSPTPPRPPDDDKEFPKFAVVSFAGFGRK